MSKRKLARLDPHELADKLFKIRVEISAFKESLEPLEKKEDELRADMLSALKEQRLDSFRDDSVPLTFVRTYRKGYEITDEKKALDWALINNCAKVDTTKLGKILTGSGDAIPAGIAYKETESLQVRSLKASEL